MASLENVDDVPTLNLIFLPGKNWLELVATFHLDGAWVLWFAIVLTTP